MTEPIMMQEGELATLMRVLPVGPEEAVQTRWGSTNPRGLPLDNPTPLQLTAVAHMRGEEHECNPVVCDQFADSPPPRPNTRGAKP